MLNKKEVVIMREIYKRTTNNSGKCTIRPVDLMASIPYNVDICLEDLSPILQGLAYDEYFEIKDVVDEENEYAMQITLLKKGYAFQRTEEQRIRNRKNSILTKVGLTLLGVALAWLLRFIISLFQNSGH